MSTKAATPAAARASGASWAGWPRGEQTLQQCVRRSLEKYFDDLDGEKPHALFEMVVRAVERPLLEFAMEKSEGNQSAAAELLGINRNTLRKKLAEQRPL
jgi:Fis family transcriptional regulator